MRLLWAVIGITLLIAVGVQSVSTADFSPYNFGYNGYSTIQEEIKNNHEVRVVAQGELAREISEVQPTKSVLFIISPETYATDEANVVRDFLLSGGRVVVADDFGGANTLLSMLDVPVAFSKEPVFDSIQYWRNVSLPMVRWGGGWIYTNYPTSLIDVMGAGGYNVAITTSPFTFADTNGDFRPNAGESIPWAMLMVNVSYGNGTLVLLGDPSVFINAMLNRNSKKMDSMNSQLMSALIDERDVVVFEHPEERIPPTVKVALAVQSSLFLQCVFALFIILGCIMVIDRRAIYKRLEKIRHRTNLWVTLWRRK